MGLFGGMKDAKSSQRGEKLPPHVDCTVEIISCKADMVGFPNKFPAFIVDLIVRESNHPEKFKAFSPVPVALPPVEGQFAYRVENREVEYPAVPIGGLFTFFNGSANQMPDQFLGNVKDFCVNACSSMFGFRLSPADFDEEEADKAVGPVLTEEGYKALAALPKPYLEGTIWGRPTLPQNPTQQDMQNYAYVLAHPLAPYYLPGRLPGTLYAGVKVRCKTTVSVAKKPKPGQLPGVFTNHNWSPVGC